MRVSRFAYRLSAVAVLAFPAAAGAETFRDVQLKASAILAGETPAAAIPGKPVASRSSREENADWCARERSNLAETAAEVDALRVAGKITEEQRILLKGMGDNALQSVNLTCDALAGRGERLSRKESNRRWCLRERAENARAVADVEALHAAGKISTESRDLLRQMGENALKSVELTCSAL